MHDPQNTAAAEEHATTSFGYRNVGEDERQRLVNQVFADVAERYDLMNDLMSGGLHRFWKDDLINWLAPPRNARAFRLLDVAGGTGDIALRFARATSQSASAVICDISPEMLAVGRDRTIDAGYDERITFALGNAESLPFADKSFDAYTIAFGIRNVTHIERALAEAYRVLRPGGRFVCLEFSHVDVPLLDRLYDAFSFKAIPQIGKLVAGSDEPYRYLVESIRKFPDQETFTGMLSEAGLARARYRNLTGGIAALHSGWRL